MFVAAWPDEWTRKRLSLLKLGSVRGLRVVRPEQWHITLRFLGEVEEDLVPAITDSLGTAARTLAGARCEVGPSTAWFGGNRVLQIPARGLDQMASAVRGATIPIVPETSHGGFRFIGHVTVARAQRRLVDPAARMDVAGIPFISTFDVEYFDLVKSEVTNEGMEYTTLARMPIAG
jgi:RNA 2',3'-cyclic 3'-phosphodiesterase